MGKSKKKRKSSQRVVPYELQNGDDGMGDNGDAPVSKPENTRGKIMQRHKLEAKAMRTRVEEIKKDRLKLSKKKESQKHDRKSITREMQQLQKDMLARQAAELAAFDAAPQDEDADMAQAPPLNFPQPPTGFNVQAFAMAVS